MGGAERDYLNRALKRCCNGVVPIPKGDLHIVRVARILIYNHQRPVAPGLLHGIRSHHLPIGLVKQI